MNPDNPSGIITDDEKYRKGWRGGMPETPCGYGSTVGQTKVQRVWLAQRETKYGVRSVVDIGAGDLNWVRHTKWDVHYTALDLVPRHSDVRAFDIRKEIPPQADLALCMWVLNHLPEGDALQALDNIRQAGYTYLAYTWFRGMLEAMDLGYDERVIIRPRIDAQVRWVAL